MNPYDLAERAASADPVTSTLSVVDQRLPPILRDGPLNDLLTGRWLGHALHPLLTDFPLGTWMSATLLDLLGAGRFRRASTTLLGVGLMASVPTVLSGIAEWDEIPTQDHPTALVHAAANGTATGLYLTSFVARTRGCHRLGVISALLGGATAVIGGYFGGHLAIGRGAGRGRRAITTNSEQARS